MSSFYFQHLFPCVVEADDAGKRSTDGEAKDGPCDHVGHLSAKHAYSQGHLLHLSSGLSVKSV